MEPSFDSPLNPDKRRLLGHFGFDRTFARGEGVWLFDKDGRRFLDGYAQYGAVALGHNAGPVVAAVRAALEAGEPAMVQPYPAPWADELARRLVAFSPPGIERCLFTNSGAEAVEAAIKLVRAKTGRPIILSTEGSFHGKTMGALAATGQARFAEGFGPTPPGFARVPFGDADALEARFVRDARDIAGFLVEPIQGERGVIVPPRGYLARVRALCSQYDVPLILDEIQTGLGRTGRRFACDHEDVRPDVLLVAKALGGGLFPLGACLSTAAMWDASFALRHSSTFANNNVACRVGVAVLEAIDGLMERVARLGERMQARLARLAAMYPGTVAATRGMGLLGAVELRTVGAEAGSTLNYMDHQGVLSWAVAALIADRASVLVLPALGEGRTIRIAPPLVIDEEQLDGLFDGVEAGCALVERGAVDAVARAVGATRVAVEVRTGQAPLPVQMPRSLGESAPDYAFIVHYTDLANLVTTDPALARLSPDELHNFSHFAARLPPGLLLRAPAIRSRTGAVANGLILCLPLLPSQMRRIGPRAVGDMLARAVDAAAAWGVRVVGLGGFTVPFSRRGLDLVGRGPAITTGNALTAAMAVAAMLRVAERRGLRIEDAEVAVVGARGSVGALAARLLARGRPARLTLVGNPASGTAHLERLREEIGTDRVRVSNDLSRTAEAQLVLAATGASQPVLDGVAFRPGTIICDVARPFDTAALRRRTDLTVIDGGLVELPARRARFGAGNLQGLPDGVQLACLSETIVWGLSGAPIDFGVGDDIPVEDADRIMTAAATHGFHLHEPARDALDRAIEAPCAVGGAS